MDCCRNVDRELDKVLDKFNTFSQDYSEKVDQLIQDANLLQQNFEDPSNPAINENPEALLMELSKRIRDNIGLLSSEHREFHGIVSKVGKAIDKNFISDFSATSNKDIFVHQENLNLLNQVICEHFLRQGKLEIADELIREANLGIDETQREPFSELNSILESLKNRDLELALRWAQRNKERLRAIKSPLEFKLHRLRFISLLEQGPDKIIEAIQYARGNFSDLANQHEKDIQVLMGSLIFAPYQGKPKCLYPYDHLHDTCHWLEICEVFTKDACALLGLSFESPLAVCINAGCTALPALLNIKQVMQHRQVTGVWNIRDELPIEIDVGKKCRFHSIFACPILRQQSTDTNPPMRLVCGHVISRDALNKLSNGNKLKCPYCPMEQNPSDANLIHF